MTRIIIIIIIIFSSSSFIIPHNLNVCIFRIIMGAVIFVTHLFDLHTTHDIHALSVN
jgi:hypothetical protein